MKRQKTHSSYASFLSVLILILTLFFLVFLNTQLRVKGYQVWKKLKQAESLEDSNRLKEVEYIKKANDKVLEQMGKKNLTFKEAKKGQVIHIREGFHFEE